MGANTLPEQVPRTLAYQRPHPVRRGVVLVAAYDGHRHAYGLRRHQLGRRRQLVGHRYGRHLQDVAVSVRRPLVVLDGRYARAADGEVDVALAPGPPERVGYDDRNVRARSVLADVRPYAARRWRPNRPAAATPSRRPARWMRRCQRWRTRSRDASRLSRCPCPRPYARWRGFPAAQALSAVRRAPFAAAQSTANAEGETSRRSTTLPSDLDTIFCVTTSASPSSSGVP